MTEWPWAARAKPMPPAAMRCMSGSSETSLREALGKYPLAHAAVPAWYTHPLYIDALVDVIRKGLRDGTEVLFSAHSLPVRFIEEGDPYVEHITGTIRAVSEKLDIRWHLGYQSRSGPVKWPPGRGRASTWSVGWCATCSWAEAISTWT